MKNVLITGGAGFIGGEIVKQLSQSGEWNIIVLDSMNEQIHGRDWENSYLYRQIKDKCDFIYGDVCDLKLMQQVLANCEYIIHLAAETGTGQSMYEINHYNKVNIMSTSNLLQAISLLGAQNKVKKIILSSSRSVYGEGKYVCPHCGVIYPDARRRDRMKKRDFAVYCPCCDARAELVPTTEDSQLKPNSLYAFTKVTQENLIKTMCPALGVDYTIFRFQNVYGVGQSLKNPYTGILSIFSSLLLKNKPINIFEDGNEGRDFINVSDVASVVVSALKNKRSNTEIINLGSGIETSVIEIARKLRKRYESESILNITGDFRIGDIAHNIADIEKAKNIFGFEPLVDLDSGLDAFCDWVRQENRDTSRYEESLSEMEEKGLFIRS